MFVPQEKSVSAWIFGLVAKGCCWCVYVGSYDSMPFIPITPIILPDFGPSRR